MLVFACLCGCVPRVCSAQGGQELLLKESSALGSQTAVSCPAGAGRSLTALELSEFSPTDRLSSTLSPVLLTYNVVSTSTGQPSQQLLCIHSPSKLEEGPPLWGWYAFSSIKVTSF